MRNCAHFAHLIRKFLPILLILYNIMLALFARAYRSVILLCIACEVGGLELL